jgi:phosphoglycolate phosphatase
VEKISLIIFDLDGTLIDSKADIANSVNFALAREGFTTLPNPIIEGFVGRGLSHLISDAIGNPSDEELWKVIQGFWSHYNEHCLDETTLYSGVQSFLEKTSSFQKAVVTNKPYLFSKKILEGLKIDHHFRWLIGGDSLPIQKPSPEVFEPIFQDFEERPQGIIIGDSQIDIECGKAAGLLTCGVSYGYRDREELVAAQPDFLIDHFEELMDLPVFKNHSGDIKCHLKIKSVV